LTPGKLIIKVRGSGFSTEYDIGDVPAIVRKVVAPSVVTSIPIAIGNGRETATALSKQTKEKTSASLLIATENGGMLNIFSLLGSREPIAHTLRSNQALSRPKKRAPHCASVHIWFSSKGGLEVSRSPNPLTLVYAFSPVAEIPGVRLS
jgi:hypothetical protein